MCQPSASSAIECEMMPAVISSSIITNVITMTTRVRFSAREKSWTKSCECRKRP